MGNLEDYLKRKLNGEQMEALVSLFGSPHMRTKKVNDPAIITHSELLELAEMLSVTSYRLFLDFGAGKSTLTVKEVEQLMFIHTTVAPNKEAAIAEVEKGYAAMAA